MIRDLYRLLIVLSATVLAVACAGVAEDTEIPVPQESRYITFDISEVDTKVSNADITSHEFAVWVYNSAATLVDGNSSKLKYDQDSNRWRFHNGSSFYDVPWGEGRHDFYAFNNIEYANASQVTLTGWTYKSPQMTRINIPAMDLRSPSGGPDYNYYKDFVYTRTSRDVTSEDGYKPVSMEFHHLWPSLEFQITNKTEQVKTVTDFSISNLKTSFDRFSFYVSNGYDLSLENHSGVEDNKYQVEEFVLAPNETRSVFGTPVMVYPQRFTYNQSAKLNLTVDGVVTTKTFYGAPESNGLSTDRWESGRLYSYAINLTTETPPVLISPDVSIEHCTDANGILTHSAVNLTLKLSTGEKLSDEDLARVKNLVVSVSQGNTVYKSYSSSTVESNEISFSSGNKYYLPQGTYAVTLTYNDGVENRTVTTNVTPPTPPYFSVTANVSATSTSFTVHSMSVNISNNVLKECPIQGHATNSFVFRIIGASSSGGYQRYIYTTDSGVSLTSSTIISNFTISNWGPQDNYGYYQIYPYVKFDGVINESGSSMNIVTSNKRESNNKIYPKEVRYSTVSQIYDSRNLEDGAMYVIRANWNSSLYWSVNTSTGQLVSDSSQTSFPKEYVFVYDRDESKEVTGGFKDTNPSNYRLESVGAWKSLATGDYMVYSGGLFYFNESSASSAQYVVCANGWDTYNTSADIDMCVDYTRMIVYTNSAFTLGTSSSAYVNYNQQWKWNIFKVQAE